MLIDVHSHYMPRALARALERRTAPPRMISRDGKHFIEYGTGAGSPLWPEFTDPDLILARMDAAGIDHAVLTVTIPGVDWFGAEEGEELAESANEETAAIVARHAHRFSGLATVPLQAPDRAAAVLQRALGRGLKGALIYSNVAGGHLDEPSRRAFFDAAAAMDAPIMLHPTYPLCAPSAMAWGLMEMVAFLFDTTTAALRLVLDGLYDRHPDFRFLVPHNGSFIPYVVGRIDMIAEARPGASGAIKVPPSAHIKKFYVDTVCGSTQSVRYCCDFFGVDHVMHGTDHPFFPMTSGLGVLEALELPPGDRQKIEYRNAAQLFQIQLPARDH